MTRTWEQRQALFAKLGHPASVFVAIHLARLVLPKCSAKDRPVAQRAIEAAQAWLDCPCEKHKRTAGKAANAAAYAAAHAAHAAAYAANSATYAAAHAAAYATDADPELDVDAEIDIAVALWRNRNVAPTFTQDLWSQP